jgi:hypothetical protein
MFFLIEASIICLINFIFFFPMYTDQTFNDNLKALNRTKIREPNQIRK